MSALPVILPPKNLQNGWKIISQTERERIDNKQNRRGFLPGGKLFIQLY
jgi:hypothetical protein